MSKQALEPLSYTVVQAATVTGVSISTLRAKCASGEIKAKRVGNRWIIPRKHLEAWLNGDDGRAGPAVPLVEIPFIGRR